MGPGQWWEARGGQAEVAQEAQLMGYAPAWGARRPEWTCPHLETGPTSPGAAPPRPPAGHSGGPASHTKSRNPPHGLRLAKPGQLGTAGPGGCLCGALQLVTQGSLCSSCGLW